MFADQTHEICNTQAGYAYEQSFDMILAGKYRHGSDEWDKKNKEYLESDDDQPYPEDLEDVDGGAYNDSVNSAEDVV